MLSCEPPAVLNVLPWPVAVPKNRVGGSPVFSFVFTIQYIGETLDTPDENGGCGYDFASGVHKFLYAEDNPVNLDDPSGNDAESGGVSVSVPSINYAAIGGDLATIGASETTETGLGAYSPSLNTAAMNLIVDTAMEDLGSWDWATTRKFGKYPAKMDKCNIFWATEAKRSLAIVPNTSNTRFNRVIGGNWPINPPTPLQLADVNFPIQFWPVIPSPVPGAVISMGDHVGIVAADSASSISVFHGTYVIHNDFAFRPPQQQGHLTPVFRGYTGPTL
jgi:hypothetical protein